MGNISRHQYYYCDICETKCKKSDTIMQDGSRRCKRCFDDKPKVKPLKWSWGSGRANYDTTTAVNTATVYSITALGGITPSHSQATEISYSPDLGMSNLPDYVRFSSYYYMKIVGSGGAIDITADPQISAGQEGDRITLEGTSDTNTVTLDNGTGLSLSSGYSMVLGVGDKITLVYKDSTWVECSRFNDN